MSWGQCPNCGATANKGMSIMHSDLCPLHIVELEIPAFLKSGEPKQETSILDEAKRIIYGDREKTYGAPDKNLRTIAELWNSYLRSLGNQMQPLSENDVCLMMILLKAARLANDPTHRDSQVDLAGYTALMERIQKMSKS